MKVAADLERLSAAAASTARLERRVGQVVHILSRSMVEALPLHPDAAKYEACLASGGDSCATIVANVVDYALFESHARERIKRDEFDMRSLTDEHGVEAVASALGELVALSRSTFERTAALMLRQQALGDAPRPALPEAAYRDLAARPIPELGLFAEEHRRVAVPSALADEFTRMAEVNDARAQRMALVALGHPENAQQLHETVLGLSHADRLRHDVAMAVSTCGVACSNTLQFTFESGSESSRTAFDEALTFAPDSDRAQLLAVVQQYAPAQIGAEEKAAQELFLRTAMSD
jgi:hypothetical protein